LYAINSESKTVKSYHDQIPKAFRSFNHSAAIKRSDGCIYFGGPGGLVYFDPTNIESNKIAPKVRFKNLRIQNNPVRVGFDTSEYRKLPLEISYLEQFTLDPNDKIFSIETEIIDLTRNDNTKVWVFLEGFDDDWHLYDNLAITRSNLKPGKYILRAKAVNNDGVTGQEIALKINVLSPWWAKWWAYLLYFALAFLTFIVVLSLKVKQAKRIEQVKAAERENFRKRSAQDFHDEAGTKITRISMLTEMAKRAAASKDDVVQHLERIEQNVQGLNAGMRDFIWALDVDKDNLLETLTRFTDFASSFCDDAKIDFHSSALDPELSSFKTEMDDRRNILLLLKEALNNSVKHGKAQQITFNVFRTTDQVKILIEDNGMGFNTKDILEGNGLKNMRRRAEKLRANLKLDSKEGKGTSVQLTMLSN
jgi:two-component sensor histidine kinase